MVSAKALILERKKQQITVLELKLNIPLFQALRQKTLHDVFEVT